jgi:hypothetical protein
MKQSSKPRYFLAANNIEMQTSIENQGSLIYSLSGIYTGDKTLHVVAIASSGDLKRWENFY